MPDLHVARQLDLFQETVALDPTWADVERIDLGAGSWIDLGRHWLRGDGLLFDQLVGSLDWGQRSRWMYTRQVDEPRLTCRWTADEAPVIPELETIRSTLSGRYDVEFDSIGMNLYRDGRDRVAWHRDKIPKTIPEPVVALVSLGARRTFALRPLEAPRAGRTLRFDLGEGDLLVTGGRCQRDWEHAVPKTASAGPRISLAFRHGEQPGYDA